MGNSSSSLMSCAGTPPRKRHTSLPSKESPVRSQNSPKTRSRPKLVVTEDEAEGTTNHTSAKLNGVSGHGEQRNAADGVNTDAEVREVVVPLVQQLPSGVTGSANEPAVEVGALQGDVPFVDEEEGDINEALSDINSVSVADSQVEDEQKIHSESSRADHSASVISVLQKTTYSKELGELEQNCCKFHSSESLAR